MAEAGLHRIIEALCHIKQNNKLNIKTIIYSHFGDVDFDSDNVDVDVDGTSHPKHRNN